MQDRCFSNCTIVSGSPLSLVSTARPSTSSAASLRGCEMQQLCLRQRFCYVNFMGNVLGMGSAAAVAETLPVPCLACF